MAELTQMTCECCTVEYDEQFGRPRYKKWITEVFNTDCLTCQIIHSGLVEFASSDASRANISIHDVYLARSWSGPRNGPLLCQITDSTGNVPKFFLELFTSEGSPTHHLEDVFGFARDLRKVRGIHGKEHRTKLSKELLNECIYNHVDCTNLTPPESTLPKRVLSLDKVGGSSDIHLVETENKEPARYACLSHCWGDSQPLTLTVENKAELKRCIGYASLPRTFQDAVTVSRELGLPYLWIDSLCIIQDDNKDWEEQSEMMGEIYGRATITIHASLARDADSGFLSSPPEIYSQCVYSANGLYSSEKMFEVICRQVIPHEQWRTGMISSNAPSPYTIGKEAPHEDILPLNKRAWASQEYILSPRSIQFGTYEMIWECTSSMSCECGSGFLPDFSAFQAPGYGRLYDRNPRDYRIKSHVTNILASAGQPILEQARAEFDEMYGHIDPSSMLVNRDPWRAFFRFWNDLVCAYTKRNIRFDRDRLVALSGVVNRINREIGQLQYYAGHWIFGPSLNDVDGQTRQFASADTKEFIYSLCWSAHTTLARRPIIECRAPTWSWPSIECEDGVDFYDLVSEVKLQNDRMNFSRVTAVPQITHLQCASTGPEGLGEVTSGRLQISARCIGAVLQHYAPFEGSNGTQNSVYTIRPQNRTHTDSRPFAFVPDDHSSIGKGHTDVLLVPVAVKEALEVSYPRAWLEWCHLVDEMQEALKSEVEITKMVSGMKRFSTLSDGFVKRADLCFLMVCTRVEQGQGVYSRVGLLCAPEVSLRSVFALPTGWFRDEWLGEAPNWSAKHSKEVCEQLNELYWSVMAGRAMFNEKHKVDLTVEVQKILGEEATFESPKAGSGSGQDTVKSKKKGRTSWMHLGLGKSSSKASAGRVDESYSTAANELSKPAAVAAAAAAFNARVGIDTSSKPSTGAHATSPSSSSSKRKNLFGRGKLDPAAQEVAAFLVDEKKRVASWWGREPDQITII